jgi:alpha-tubulin suppressor-like RCC1 family protein
MSGIHQAVISSFLDLVPKLQLWAWGRNSGAYAGGQLGLNDTISRSSPVQVGALTDWKIATGGGLQGFAVKTDGTLWSWGRATFGETGLNSTIARSSPVQVGALTGWSNVSGGSLFAVFLKTDGTLWSCGSNSEARTGLGTTAGSVSSPVQIGSASSWVEVSGKARGCVAKRTNGTLWSWGRNSGGQLGVGDTSIRLNPTQIGSLTNWRQASSRYSTLAVKTDGTLWAWGENTYGELGLGDAINRSSPVQVGALTNWSHVEVVGVGARAVKTDGTLWTWGRNTEGQLGLNDIINRSSPVQVGALSDWLKISGFGNYATLAIKTNGTLWAWGRNYSGVLGIGNAINRSSPVQVGALTNWVSIGTGDTNSFALKKS